MKREGMIALDRSLLRVGERVCCAVSGGADSVAMLLAMTEWNARKESLGVVLSVVHVHHGLRGEQADGDEAFVRTLCDRLCLPLTVIHVDTAARQLEAREGVEDAARTLRYEVLWGLLGEGQADVVTTAHTLDDQAETILLKLLRGAWTEGLGGISPVLECDPAPTKTSVTRSAPLLSPGRIARPLLRVRRAEVETFLKARGQAWREDETNRDLRLTRNRVRHELMPQLRTYNPAVDVLLAQTAEIARDEESYWQAEVGRVLPPLLLPGTPVRGGGRAVGTQADERTVAIELVRLRTLPRALQRRALRAAVRTLGVRLTGDETARLMALAGLAEHPFVTGRIGARLELRAGLRAARSARELRLWGRFGAGQTKLPNLQVEPAGPGVE